MFVIQTKRLQLPIIYVFMHVASCENNVLKQLKSSEEK